MNSFSSLHSSEPLFSAQVSDATMKKSKEGDSEDMEMVRKIFADFDKSKGGDLDAKEFRGFLNELGSRQRPAYRPARSTTQFSTITRRQA